MEAKELIEQAKNSVIDQAYIKGCPNSPQEWFVSTEKLIPLQEMAIFKAGIREVVGWFKEFIYRKQGGIGILIPPATYASKLKEWGIE